MPSFLEKLKKGMGSNSSQTNDEIEEKTEVLPEKKKIVKKKVEKVIESKKIVEEIPEEIEEEIEKVDKLKKVSIKAEPMKKIEKQTKKPEKEILKEKKISFVESLKAGISPNLEEKRAEETAKEKWQGIGGEDIGELAVDVYQTGDELVIQAAIAGIKTEDIDISLEGDVISIKGIRKNPYNEGGSYFFQECYWGPFAKELILPVEVDPNLAKAEMKEGILTIRIPKIEKEKKRKILVRE